jgi:hypothetical protein
MDRKVPLKSRPDEAKEKLRERKTDQVCEIAPGQSDLLLIE